MKMKQSEEFTMIAYIYACAFNEEYHEVLKFRTLIPYGFISFLSLREKQARVLTIYYRIQQI